MRHRHGHREALGWLGGEVCVQQRLSFLLIPVPILHSESLFTCQHKLKKKSYLVCQEAVYPFATRCKHSEYLSTL